MRSGPRVVSTFLLSGRQPDGGGPCLCRNERRARLYKQQSRRGVETVGASISGGRPKKHTPSPAHFLRELKLLDDVGFNAPRAGRPVLCRLRGAKLELTWLLDWRGCRIFRLGAPPYLSIGSLARCTRTTPNQILDVKTSHWRIMVGASGPPLRWDFWGLA